MYKKILFMCIYVFTFITISHLIIYIYIYYCNNVTIRINSDMNKN